MKSVTLTILGLAILATTASASDGTPRLRLTERQNELARTTGLRPRDLPARFHGGFVKGSPRAIQCPTLHRYGSAPTATGYAKARFVDANGNSVTSMVTILSGPTQVTSDLRQTIRAPLATCLGQDFAAADQASLVSADRKPFRTSLQQGALYRLVLRRLGVYRTIAFYLLGEGRIEGRLVVDLLGRTSNGGVEKLARDLLQSRMED